MLEISLTNEEREAIKSFFEEKGLSHTLALTFDDVALPENFSNIRSRSEIEDFRTTLIPNKFSLNIPFISANMESVTGSALTIALEGEGGLGILPQSLPLKERIAALEKIRRANCALIEDPITIEPEATLEKAKKIMMEFKISSLLVVDKNKKLVGILSHRDWFYEENGKTKISDLMTRKVITAPRDVGFKKAGEILKEKKIEKLPLVNKEGELAGLITAHGLFYKKHHPRALRDENGQWIRVGSIGVKKEFSSELLDEVKAQMALGIKILLIDTARAFSINTKEVIEGIKKSFPKLSLIVGNVSTPEGAKFLFESGADVVKVGQGPGQACTTRVVGIGIPQLTAVAKCGVIAKLRNKTVIADGGTRNPGDIAKALIAGADAIMIGKLFAGTEESASPAYPLHLKELGTDITAKDYAGSASFEAQNKRYLRKNLDHIRRPEGIKKIVPVIGTLKSRVDDLLAGLRSTMSYMGVTSVSELKKKGKFVMQTSAGHGEGVKKY